MFLWDGLLTLVKVSRPGFWPTQLWFYLLPFAGRDMFGISAFWLGAFYVCFPLGLLLYGWNDICDADTDSLNPRKDSWIFGARPDAATRRWLPTAIAVVHIPFVVLFVAVAGAKMLVWALLVFLSNATYNTFGFKQRPVLDILNQVGYVLVFVLGSWLCFVPQLNAPAMLFSAIFAMLSQVFGQLMDVDPDREAGRKSTVILMGVQNGKLMLVAMMLIEAGIAWTYFTGWYIALFMLAGAIYFFFDAIFGPDRYPMWFTKTFFVGWNIIVVVTMHFIWRYGVFQLPAT